MDTRRDIGGPERLAALANSADGYGKRPIKFHSLPSRQMTSDIIMPRARDPCHHEEPRREKGTAVYRGLSLIDYPGYRLPVFHASRMLIRSAVSSDEWNSGSATVDKPPSKARPVRFMKRRALYAGQTVDTASC